MCFEIYIFFIILALYTFNLLWIWQVFSGQPNFGYPEFINKSEYEFWIREFVILVFLKTREMSVWYIPSQSTLRRKQRSKIIIIYMYANEDQTSKPCYGYDFCCLTWWNISVFEKCKLLWFIVSHVCCKDLNFTGFRVVLTCQKNIVPAT